MSGQTASRRLFVVTGPSGAGKGTMVQALLERVPQLCARRLGDDQAAASDRGDGVHYWFLSDEEFDRRLAAGDFLEFVEFPWGQRSGTLVSELDRITRAGHVPLLELELQGSLAVKEKEAGAITIFVDAPLDELERRLRGRATESAGEIEERIALAAEQTQLADRFDYVVENDDRERARGRVRCDRRTRARRGSYHGASMIHPRIDQLLAQVDSRYALAIVAAKRARQINNYHHQLGEGTFDEFAPPLIQSRSKNYLTMSLEEIAEGKIKYEYTR